MSELEYYKKQVLNHPMRKHIEFVGAYTIKRDVVATTVLFEKGMRFEYTTGIAICNDEDEFDYETGKVVALLHALNQAKGRFKS